MAAAPAKVTDVAPKKKKKSIFGALFHLKKHKKKEKTYAVAYVDNEVTSGPTQFQHSYVPATDNQSALSIKRPAPTPPNYDNEPSHVADDVIAVRANGVSVACSRSSSRSSGFDEISSAFTECSSLLPVTLAHAPDDRPEMTLSETIDDGDKQLDISCENSSNIKNDDSDAGSLDTLRVAVDNHDNDSGDKTDSEPQQIAGDDQQDSCSSQAQQDKAEADLRVEELSRQIESMSERFNKLFARVKAAENAELRRSTISLTETSDTRLPYQTRSFLNSTNDVRQRPSTVDRYSRNTAYRQWLIAKSGLLPDSVGRPSRQPITAAAAADVGMVTDAPVDQLTANSAMIGQQTDVKVTAPSEENQASVTSSEFDVTSEVRVPHNQNHVFTTRTTGNTMVDSPEQDIHNAETITDPDLGHEVSSDLQTTFRPSMYDHQSSVSTAESLALKYRPTNVRLPRLEGMDGRLESLNGRNSSHDGWNVCSQSDYTSRSLPRSMFRQSEGENVFIENAITTPVRSLSHQASRGLAPRRLLPAIPSHQQPASASSQAPDDVFSETVTSSTTPSHESSRASRPPRLRPASSLDSVGLPRLLPVRRRSLLEQSADVKGQFARWHQQLSSSRSLSPSATPATKVVPLRALPVQSTSASSSSTSPPAGGDAATPSVWITPLKTLPEIHTGSSSSSSSSSPLASETFPSAAHGLPTFDHQSTQHTHGSLEMTSSWPAAGGWSRDDVATCSLARGVGRGGGRRLYRSDSLPAGGTEQAARARATVAIPRTAMAHFNADGTPKSILKKTVSVSNDEISQ